MSELHSELEREVKLSVPAVFALPPLIDPEPAVPIPGLPVAGLPAAPAPGGPVFGDHAFGHAAPDDPVFAEPVFLEPEVDAEAPSEPAMDPGIPVRAVAGPRLALRAAYWDTTDLRLARSGLTLRARAGEGKPKWTLKVAAASGVEGERVELSLPGPATAMPAELRELTTAYARSASLEEVVRLTTRRDSWELQDAAGARLAEVVDDLVSVIAGGKVVARFRELEIERHGIGDDALAALIGRLEAAGAVRGAFQSKLVRALGPRASAAPDVPAPTTVKKGDPASALLAQALRSSVTKLLAQDAGVRLGHHDAVHQMRVACRRMRSDLRTFGSLIERDSVATLIDELAWLAGELGNARDLEVLRARLAKTFGADPLAPLDATAFSRLDAILAAREAVAQDAAAAALRNPRYVALLDLAVAVAREPATTVRAADPVRDVLPALVATAVTDLDLRVERLRPGGADDRWHRARIRAKRARYAAEAAATALGKPAARTGAVIAAVQEVLGDHQDAAIAADAVLAVAADHPDDPALVLVCGRLAERERRAVRDARAGFAAVWARAADPARRRWLPAPEPAAR